MPFAIDQPGYLGRRQQGEELPLVVQCVDAAGAPVDPDACPWVSVFRDAEPPVLVESREVPADLRGVESGVFRLPLFLGGLYGTPGRHLVVTRYTVGGVGHAKIETFTLLPGGSPDGAVTAMTFVRRPDATYILYSTDAGRLIRGRNPR